MATRRSDRESHSTATLVFLSCNRFFLRVGERVGFLGRYVAAETARLIEHSQSFIGLPAYAVPCVPPPKQGGVSEIIGINLDEFQRQPIVADDAKICALFLSFGLVQSLLLTRKIVDIERSCVNQGSPPEPLRRY